MGLKRFVGVFLSLGVGMLGLLLRLIFVVLGLGFVVLGLFMGKIIGFVVGIGFGRLLLCG